MKVLNWILLVIFILVFILVLIGTRPPAQITPVQVKGNYVTFQTDSGNVLVEVEIADDAAERQVGLMNREFLGPNKGMLFIFEGEQHLNFWMKNTLIPLDIIFISEDLEVVNIQEANPCKADPCQFYSSTEASRYVVEVDQGFSSKRGISTGTKVELQIE